MGVTRMMRAVSSAVLAVALAVALAPTAQADQVRDGEWAVSAYQMTKVWPISTGKGVIVAVIDSGVRATHVDLSGQVLPGTDFVHGGNGHKDYSDDGHGTGVASIIAGHGHGPGHQDGIIGLAPGAKILPIGVDPGTQHTDDTGKAIRYAVDHGAKIINLSLGQPGFAPVQEQRAVAYAEAHNVIVVGAAGNEGADTVDFPAGYPGVVSVGAVGKDGHVWRSSNSGSNLVLTAPGVDIVRAGDGSDTQAYEESGTSFAAPMVSAAAALVWAKFPNLTAGQVINRLIKTAKIDASAKSGKDPDPQYGYGIVRPYQALTADIPPGPAGGPLPQVAASAGASNPASDATGSGSGATASSSGSSTSAVVIIAVVALVALLLLVLLVVLAVRRNKRNNGGGSGPGSGVQNTPYPPYPPYGQQQPQAPFPPQTAPPGGYRPAAGGPDQSVYQNGPYPQSNPYAQDAPHPPQSNPYPHPQSNPYGGEQQSPPHGGQPR